MLVELEARKTVEGVGFRFEESDSGHFLIVEVINPGLNLKPGDVLLSICGSGLRGFSFADVAEKLNSIPPETDFSLFVGRKPTPADWEKYGGPTKDDLRKKIWDKLEKEDIADFPRPCHHRIPNFKGSKGGCDRLLSLPAFTSAKTIKINPDKPQQHARYLTLQQRKKLLVPTPRLRSGLFNHIQPPEAPTAEELKRCCTAQGVKEFGIPIPLETKMKVDLVVIGSVVVSQRGFRIGKGEGFADMEWAMMASTGAVGPETIIVTIVHDEQILDIPPFLVDSHDMTVDFILTPTRLLECRENLPRPTGIIWDKLTPERINEIPILKKILEMEREKGKNVVLKTSTSDDTSQRRGGRGGSGRGFRGRGGKGSSGGANDLCFKCQSPGHWAKECTNQSEADSQHMRRDLDDAENEAGGEPSTRTTGLSRTIRGDSSFRGGNFGARGGRGDIAGGRGSRGGRGGGRGRGSYAVSELRCYNCGEAGHYARDCLSDAR